MSEAEQDARLRQIMGHLLRDHVAYQDGRDSCAPSAVYANADYEMDDGRSALHIDGKYANEPAIIYVRADALIDALDAAEAREKRLREALEALVEHGAFQDNEFLTHRLRELLTNARAALNGESEG